MHSNLTGFILADLCWQTTSISGTQTPYPIAFINPLNIVVRGYYLEKGSNYDFLVFNSLEEKCIIT